MSGARIRCPKEFRSTGIKQQLCLPVSSTYATEVRSTGSTRMKYYLSIFTKQNISRLYRMIFKDNFDCFPENAL